MAAPKKIHNNLKEKLHEIIFESDTPAGRLFDLTLFWSIILSIFVVMLESVESIEARFYLPLKIMEYFFTGLFTVEYVARLYTLKQPLKYARSFLGFVDLLAILPTYLALLIPGTHYLMAIRTLRLIRIFRILKLGRYLKEAEVLITALKAARPKITVFLVAVIAMVIILGTVMYQIEGQANGFTSIPKSIYWAIVTLTTVGYGDIAPKTVMGQFIASVVMILGYAIIAIPTGIVTSEFARKENAAPKKNIRVSTQACKSCGREGHDQDAQFCKYCGDKI